MKRKDRRTEYEQSPWSGETYTRPPTVEELTAESMEVLERNPAIAKTVRLESMDSFIAQYKAQHGIK